MMSQPVTDNAPVRSDGQDEHYFLSQEDVDRLLEDDSPDSRIDVMEKISDQYGTRAFSESELLYAEQIFRLLLQDTELRVRKALAVRLSTVDHVPRDIVLSLAQDRAEVAVPVIERSQVLSDADLIRLIENSREMQKIAAVARRGKVSERVSSALIGTHYPQVVKTLLDNMKAQIAGRDYEAIVKEHSGNEAMMAALATRETLPLPVVEQLVHLVSAQLAEELQRRYDVDLADIRDRTRESMTLHMLPYSASDEEIEATVQQMQSFERLTPSVVLSALCQGHIRFFEIALARLAHIPKANARKLVRDKGLLGFEALYEKTQMPESTYEAVRLLLGVVLELENEPDCQPGTPHYANAVIERLLMAAGDREVDNLSYIIALVRQAIVH